MNDQNNITRHSALPSYSTSALDRDLARASALSGGQFMDMNVGENVVRFLPPRAAEESPFRLTAMHYVDAVPGLDKLIVFACPRVELKEPCVVCAKVEELRRTRNPVDRERADRIAASLRIYANVVDRATGEVKVLAFGKAIQMGLATVRKSQRAGGDFTDVTARGFDIIITRTGEGMSTRYTVTPSRDSTPLAETPEEVQAILASQHDLEAFVDPMTPAALMQVWGAALRGESSLGAGQQTRTVAQQAMARTLPASGERVGSGVMNQRVAAPTRTVVQDSQGKVADDDV